MANEKQTDLISRSKLIAEYDRVHIGPPGGARKLMVDAPTVDAVEVVRCKDCAYKVFDKTSQEYYCNHTFGMYGDINDIDFCSYGERRTDG